MWHLVGSRRVDDTPIGCGNNLPGFEKSVVLTFDFFDNTCEQILQGGRFGTISGRNFGHIFGHIFGHPRKQPGIDYGLLARH